MIDRPSCFRRQLHLDEKRLAFAHRELAWHLVTNGYHALMPAEALRLVSDEGANGRAMLSGEARITPYRDGPLLVRGPFVLTDQEGNTIRTDRETIALCRCGKSRVRPFCDGTHKTIHFSAPSGAEDRTER